MADLSVNRNDRIIKQLHGLLLDQEDAIHDLQHLAGAANVLCDGSQPLEPQDVTALLSRLSVEVRAIRKRHERMCGVVSDAGKGEPHIAVVTAAK